ncbi:hypothetical protein Tco_0357843 [Tanacetum coccineum]
MALGEVVTNLPPSILGWKGLGNRSLDLLALQPLQLMLKTRLLTLRRYSLFRDVLMNSRLGWQVTSLKGDALNWWKGFKQAKGGETYMATGS